MADMEDSHTGDTDVFSPPPITTGPWVDITRSCPVSSSPASPSTPQSPTTPTFVAYTGCEALDLTKPDDFSDVSLKVEGRSLYTCRGILASASPVWRRMFVSDFKEKDAKEIPLPDKKCEDVMEMLLCISPAIQKPITGDNVFQVLPLADEYQMGKVKWDCETWLLCQLESLTSCTEQHMKYVSLAQQYGLDRLLERAVDLVSDLAVTDLETHPDYAHLDTDTVVKILKRRVSSLEKSDGKLRHSMDNWRKRCEELEDVLKKMAREKLTIKRALDEMECAWEAKGSDTRCIDPVHIYGPRNYKCDKCTQQVHTYIQSKVWYLLNKGSTWSGVSWPQ